MIAGEMGEERAERVIRSRIEDWTTSKIVFDI